MKNLKFPLRLQFNIGTLANDFSAKDSEGMPVAYVKQKLFKLKEDVLVYNDEHKSKINYRIRADKWIDFSAAYSIKSDDGRAVGKIARKGWKSLWKTEYELIDQNETLQYHVREDNPWVKVFDRFIGEIPILSFFTGYLFNPTYSVLDLNNTPIAKLKKESSFFGRKFELSKLEAIDQDDQERIVLGLMMMVLLERRKG